MKGVVYLSWRLAVLRAEAHAADTGRRCHIRTVAVDLEEWGATKGWYVDEVGAA